MTEIVLRFSDILNTSADLKASILARVESGTPRGVWTPQDFLDLGTRDALNKALQRLTSAGSLRRAGRGLYDKPSYNSLTQINNPPDSRQIIETIARRDQIRVLVDGMSTLPIWMQNMLRPMLKGKAGT